MPAIAPVPSSGDQHIGDALASAAQCRPERLGKAKCIDRARAAADFTTVAKTISNQLNASCNVSWVH